MEKTEPVRNVPRENLCPRCKENPASTSGNVNRWCRACCASYRRDYEGTKKKRDERRGYLQGFSEGASAIQARLWLRFARVPGATFAGHEIVAMIKSEPAPKAPGN